MVNKIKNTVSIAFHSPFDTSSPEGRSKERARRIALTAIAAAVSKVFSTIIPLITVRITLKYLGLEMYGLWNAVTSFFALFAFADLGLGNGLQTVLSRANGKEDVNLQHKVIVNSYFMLTIIAGILVLIFICAYPIVDWAKLMNATDETTNDLVGGVILAIVIPKLLSIPLSLVQRVQLAYQEAYNSHWWQCVASVFSLIGIFVVYKWDLGKLAIIWTSSCIPVVIFLLNSIVYYSRINRKIDINVSLFDKSIMTMLLNIGIAYFFLSVLTTLGLAIDTFLVAKLGTLEDAAPFSILHKLTCFISIICGMISTPLWSANGEAMARGEFDWVRRNTQRISVISILFSVLTTIIFVLTSRFIFRVWLGPEFEFSMSCLFGMCITQVILSAISPFFMILNAAGIVIKQIIVFSVYTIISLVLKILFANKFGVNSIPWITNICYMVLIVPFVVKWSWSIVNKK